MAPSITAELLRSNLNISLSSNIVKFAKYRFPLRVCYKSFKSLLTTLTTSAIESNIF